MIPASASSSKDLRVEEPSAPIASQVNGQIYNEFFFEF